MSALRDKMERDMKIRGYARRTQLTYLNCVRDLAIFHGRSPDQLGLEEIH